MTPVLRAAFQASGSPRWLMETIRRDGLDRAHGFRLDLCLLAEDDHRHGTLAALVDGRADLADADWLALARARDDGLAVTAVHPYGRILGSLVGARGRSGDGLAALPGCRLGVLSTNDKNWSILAAACADRAGFALADVVRVQPYATRAELVAALTDGRVDAALLHWHLVPGLSALGHPVLAEIPELADGLGGDAVPTTFFVVPDALAAEHPGLVAAFIAAAGAATVRLRDDPEAWATIAAATGAGPGAQATDLRTRWRQRVADGAVWSRRSRGALAALRARLDAERQPLPAGLFHPVFLP